LVEHVSINSLNRTNIILPTSIRRNAVTGSVNGFDIVKFTSRLNHAPQRTADILKIIETSVFVVRLRLKNKEFSILQKHKFQP
jgi:hypothetical protein